MLYERGWIPACAGMTQARPGILYCFFDKAAENTVGGWGVVGEGED